MRSSREESVAMVGLSRTIRSDSDMTLAKTRRAKMSGLISGVGERRRGGGGGGGLCAMAKSASACADRHGRRGHRMWRQRSTRLGGGWRRGREERRRVRRASWWRIYVRVYPKCQEKDLTYDIHCGVRVTVCSSMVFRSAANEWFCGRSRFRANFLTKGPIYDR